MEHVLGPRGQVTCCVCGSVGSRRTDPCLAGPDEPLYDRLMWAGAFRRKHHIVVVVHFYAGLPFTFSSVYALLSQPVMYL